LKCDDYPIDGVSYSEKESMDNTINNFFFKTNTKIVRRELQLTFNLLGSDANIPVDLKVKLANLYFLESFLIPTQGHNKVSWKHLKMLDDEKKFRSYPWGRVSFELTIEIFKNGVINNQSSIFLPGFPLALVYWAFEVIPRLSNATIGFVRRIKSDGPRIAQWESQEPNDWQHINNNIFKVAGVSLLSLLFIYLFIISVLLMIETIIVIMLSMTTSITDN